MKLSHEGLVAISTLVFLAAAFAAPPSLAADDPIEFINPLELQPRDPAKSAVLTFRGHGKEAVDILDRTGKVIESIDQKTLVLNQSPPHVIARRTAALERRRELGRLYRLEKKEQARLAAEDAAIAAEEAWQAQRIVDLEETVKAMEAAMRTPRRDRYTGRMVTLL